MNLMLPESYPFAKFKVDCVPKQAEANHRNPSLMIWKSEPPTTCFFVFGISKKCQMLVYREGRIQGNLSCHSLTFV